MTVRRGLTKTTLCSVALFLGMISAAYGTAPAGILTAGALTGRSVETGHRDAIPKIISVLAIKSADGKALGRAAEKLSTMSDRDLRLIASLCDRISADRSTAGADLAFSLVSAMIVLS